LVSGRRKVLPAEGWFYEAKLKLLKFTLIKGLIRKFKNQQLLLV
jgi:hypothetical protein